MLPCHLAWDLCCLAGIIRVLRGCPDRPGAQSEASTCMRRRRGRHEPPGKAFAELELKDGASAL